MEQMQVDGRIQRMIKHAQWDYAIRPSPGLRGILSFRRAMRVPPNDIYLIFSLNKPPYHSEVYYRVALEDGRLLWKCGAGTD
jgi:hypothetical protein